jgi:SAM-dependent methyltransferase
VDKVSRVTPWHEDEVFWRTAEPVLFSQQRIDNTPAQVDAIVSLVDLRPGAQVLDLACGVGRHSLELARRGFHVVGVDRTDRYLKRAREIAAQEGLAVEFVLADMREFCRTRAFDVVLNMFTSFGYFEDQNEDITTAKNVLRSLRSGGRFLVDMMGKEILPRIFTERDWQEVDDMIILEERKVLGAWKGMEARWIVVKDGDVQELTLSHRLYSAAELEVLFRQCGFSRVDAYGHVTGTPYDHTAKRLVAVAYK